MRCTGLHMRRITHTCSLQLSRFADMFSLPGLYFSSQQREHADWCSTQVKFELFGFAWPFAVGWEIIRSFLLQLLCLQFCDLCCCASLSVVKHTFCVQLSN